jgi:hypothetical protein
MIHFLPFYHYSRQFIIESVYTFRHHWSHSLTRQQQILTIIALAALSSLGMGYVLHLCWRKTNVTKGEEDVALETDTLSPILEQKVIPQEEVEPLEDKVIKPQSPQSSSDESPASNEVKPSLPSPMNRFEKDQIFHMGKILTVRAKAANMSLMDFVLAEVNGKLPPPSTGARPAYPQEVEHAMSNFTRLFHHGNTLIQPFENNLPLLDPNQEDQQFSITSPKELARANLAIHAMLEEVILEEIKQNPQYASYCRQVQTTDFRDIGGISAKKIIGALQSCQLIDQDCRLISDKPDQNAIDHLEKIIRKPEICKQILDVLYCVAFRSQKEMIRLRLTKSTFLDPRILCNLSQNQLTIEEANLLLTCLGLKENKKETNVCNLRTSEYSQEIVNKLRKENSPSLYFIDPNTRQVEAKFSSKIDEKENVQNGRILDQGTKALTGLTYEKLMPFIPFLDSQSHDYLRQQVLKGSADHVYLRKIFFESNQLEQFFKEILPEEKGQLIPSCFEEIRTFLSWRLDKLDEVVKDLPNPTSVMDECLTIEAETRLREAIAVKDQLYEKFQKFKHILRQFLLFSTQTFELAQTYHYDIMWKMDNVEVKEVINLEKKSCAVSRRLHFPASGNQRTDLTYFAEKGSDCIANRWLAIRGKYRLRETELAQKCLKLYTEGALDSNEEPEIKQFLVPLVILLMGKEPALDRSSLAANFILLLSVKLGMCSFAKALKSMPMIPQGAVSAKQFLLHITEHSLDAISGVQYKDHKTILRSYFLPTVAAFIGTARDWTEKYDDVATIAVECCQKIFVSPIRHSRSLHTLMRDLNGLLEHQLAIWEIPHALDCRKIEEKQTAVKEICLQYVESIGKETSLPNDDTRSLAAVELCKEELTSSNDPLEEELVSLIDSLKDVFDQEDPPNELAEMLDMTFGEELIHEKQRIAREYLKSIGEPDDIETAIERCQALLTPGIDCKDPRIQELKTLLEELYQMPVPYPDLPVAIDYQGFNDDQDEIGKWAIDYALDFHPLRNPS